MQLATKLKSLREKYGFLQKEVAEGIGVSVPIISNYEKGKKMPSRDTPLKLAKFYGITTSQLLEEVEDATLEDNTHQEIQEFLNGVRVHFMDASEKDRDAIYRTISELYWEAKAKQENQDK